MKTSIATVCIAGDLREKLARHRGGRLRRDRDLRGRISSPSDASPRDVGAMVRDHGLEISLFQPFRDFEGLPEPERTRAFDRMERKFDLMQELGTDLVLVCSSCHPKALGGIDRMAADFAELGDRASKRGVARGLRGPGLGQAWSGITATPGRWCAAPIIPISG